jgi:hypothetical protein
VVLDGTSLGSTGSTALRPPAPLAQGPHSFHVSVSNPAGLSNTGRSMSLFVDSLPPVVTLSLSGRLFAGATLKLHALYTDAPPPLAPADASGVALVQVRWGDGTKLQVIHHWSLHVYKKPGRYRVTVYVTDRAGNLGRATLIVRVKAKPKPKRKRAEHRASGR